MKKYSGVIILGGGFGGVRVAQELSKKLGSAVQITVIDKKNHHLFYPALYEVASAYIDKYNPQKHDPYDSELRNSVSIPFSDIFSKYKNVDFIQAEVASVNLRAKEVCLESDNVINFKYLVIAMGSEVATFDIPGVEEYAYSFRTINDAILIHQRLNELHNEIYKGKKSSPIKVIIGGGGFTGVELAGELLSSSNVFKKMNKLKDKCIEITMLEASDKIMGPISKTARKQIEKRLKRLGVIIKTNKVIEKIDGNSLEIKGGEIMVADMIIWTAGIKGPALLSRIDGLRLDNKDRAKVEKNMQAVGEDCIYVIGDNAISIDQKTGTPVPALGYVASDQAKVVAQNIGRQMRGEKTLKNYKPNYSTWVIPIGGKFAVAHLPFKIIVVGFFGWVIRVLVNLRYFISIMSLLNAFRLLFKETRLFIKND